MGAPQAISDRNLPKKYHSDRNLRRCTSRKRDNIVLIDVDSDDLGDVIILDVPESFKKRFRKKPKNVISIDDDEDEDGGGESSDGARDTNNGASTSNRCCPTESAHPSTSAYAAEGSLFGNEGNTPVKFSKSKRTYGKSICRNRYGLNPDSEGCSSESDCSDCELMEGSSGNLREQWEKAFHRKRNGCSSVPPDFDDEAGTAGPSHNFQDVTSEEGSDEDPQPPGEQSNLKNRSMHLDDNGFSGSSQEFSDGSEDSEQVEDPMEMNQEFTCTTSHSHHGSAREGTTLDKESLCQQSNVKNCSLHHGGDSVVADSPQKSYGRRSKASEQDFNSAGMNPQFTSACDDHMSSGYDNDRSDTCAPSCPPVNHVGDQCTVKTSEPVGGLGYSVGKLAEQVKIPQLNNETRGPCQDGENQPALSNSQQSAGILPLMSDLKSSCGYGNEAVSSSDQNSLITDRQKIKETEEYKHAMEEEWAARQQQLLRQAEEARRLRNRKKAENMRIMMNERRQKERLEEIRQTRIRDEENSNIKEKHRAEIKKELHRIEAMCGDMASLLRCLGIHVSGGPFPSPHEVQVAYKRACLKFHPDRISASDLRQQVEAEEKFKLISNMKDKFSF